MELSWSTFLLEIVNFLVLVWILKRFLYKPVLKVIEQRRGNIENQLAESRHLNAEAGRLKAEYENRLGDWDRERQQLRDKLAKELDTERARQIETLQATLATEREKAQVAESRKREDAEREAEQHALLQAAQFASRLLGQAAGPELETYLVDLLLDGLASLPDDRIATIRNQWGEPPESIRIASAYPLAEDRRQRLEQALKNIVKSDLPVNYKQESELLAGLRITVGAWVMQANVHDELAAFVEFSHALR